METRIKINVLLAQIDSHHGRVSKRCKVTKDKVTGGN